jgi:hypothetical protein
MLKNTTAHFLVSFHYLALSITAMQIIIGHVKLGLTDRKLEENQLTDKLKYFFFVRI